MPVITVFADKISYKSISLFLSLINYFGGFFLVIFVNFIDIFKSEYILGEFEFEFSRRAVGDRILRNSGVFNYVNTVLMPELAVMLIKEDIGVNDEETRRIL